MNAILLAAGFGTRLRPLTDNIPKCLVPIGGEPLLQIWIKTLVAGGIHSFLINTHYLYKHVDNFVAENDFNSRLKTTYEPLLLGTAGTLKKNVDFFDNDDGMLIHADNYCMANIQAFIAAHKSRPSHCLMTMMVFRTETPSTCGIVEVDDKNIVTGFHEKVLNPPGNLANGAVYILSKELLKQLPEKYTDATDFSLDILPDLIGKIFVYETNNFFIDIGTPLSYEKANLYAKNTVR